MQHSVKEQWALRQAALVAFAAGLGIRADASDPIIASYIARQEDLVTDSQTIIARADGEQRELSVEEKAAISNNTAEVERLQNEIEQRQRVTAQADRLRTPQQRQTPANSVDPLGSEDESQQQAVQQRPLSRGNVQTTHLNQPRGAFSRENYGFRNMAEFAHAVRRAAAGQGLDQRLQNAAASSYGSEGTGADGGFAVPPEYRREIEGLVMGEESLFSRCDTMPTDSNSVTIPTDETTAWGTSGVRSYWGSEAAAMTQSKPQLKEVTTRLNKLYALVPLTDELLEDAPASSALITRKAGEAMQFKLTDAILNGSGVGQPLGILNAGCLVSVAAEASQTAGTIHAKNVAKMWARMPGSARSRAVWLANQDVESSLMEMGFQVTGPNVSAGATGGIPLFIPPGGLSALPYSTLLGRPVITTEACAALGTVGDLILAFLPGYFAPYKSGGMKNAVSMHLWFDQDIVAFKWTLRLGGQPWLSAPIARKSGSNTLSHFVALVTRS